jgi:hypothetical protein
MNSYYIQLTNFIEAESDDEAQEIVADLLDDHGMDGWCFQIYPEQKEE